MAIVGQRPETGVRIALERPRSGGPPWSYAGAAVLPDASFPLRVTVSEAGEVDVELSPSVASGSPPPADLQEKVRLIVRTVYRQAKSDGEAPARSVVRWRGEK